MDSFSGDVGMFDSFRAYKTSKAHEYGVGWCLHIIRPNFNDPTERFWFKDLSSLLAFLLAYPEGQYGKEL
jgi:hypothetical protein